MTTSCTIVTEELAHDLGVVVDNGWTMSSAVHAHATIVETHARLTGVIAVGNVAHRWVELVAPNLALFFCDGR